MLQILPFHSHSIVSHEEDQLSVTGRQRELHPVRMAVDNHILYEVIQNPQIGVGVKTYPERLFGDVNLIVDPLFLQNRDPVDEDVPRQFASTMSIVRINSSEFSLNQSNRTSMYSFRS